MMMIIRSIFIVFVVAITMAVTVAAAVFTVTVYGYGYRYRYCYCQEMCTCCRDCKTFIGRKHQLNMNKHQRSRRSRIRIPLKPWFLQASSFQLLILENLLRRSLFTFIYNRSSNMNYFIYTSQELKCERIIDFSVVSSPSKKQKTTNELLATYD